jgi:hypothetical protein
VFFHEENQAAPEMCIAFPLLSDPHAITGNGFFSAGNLEFCQGGFKRSLRKGITERSAPWVFTSANIDARAFVTMPVHNDNRHAVTTFKLLQW